MRLRDERLELITNGYLKDVQHLKEMFIRKDLYPEDVYYEVMNYDMMNNFDESTQ